MMPPWEQHLTTDEIWKVILFEWHTGYYPRDMGLILNLTNNLGEQVRLTMSKLRMNVKLPQSWGSPSVPFSCPQLR